MSFLNILYTLLIQPLQLFFELIYMAADWIIGDPGLSIIALSLAKTFWCFPFTARPTPCRRRSVRRNCGSMKG